MKKKLTLIETVVAGPGTGLVSSAEVMALLEHLKEHKFHVEGAMTLLLSVFSILAQSHGLEWPDVQQQAENTFEKAKTFEIAVISGPSN